MIKVAKRTSPGEVRFGIAARLGLTFAAILVSMAAIIVQTLLAYSDVGRTLRVVVEETLPKFAVLDSLTLAADRLAGAAGQAAVAGSSAEAKSAKEKLAQAEADFDAALRSAPDGLGDIPALAAMRTVGGRFSAEIQVLSSSVDGRWRLQAQLGERLAQVLAGRDAALAALSQEGAGRRTQVPSGLLNPVITAYGALVTAAGAPTAARLAEQQTIFETAVGEIEAILAAQPGSIREGLPPILAELRARADGRSGVFGLRGRLLAADEQIRNLVGLGAQNAALLREQVKGVAGTVQADVRHRTDELGDGIAFARTLLIVLGVVGTGIAVGAAVFYAGVRVAGRIGRLSRQMLDLAAGNLGVEIDTGGSDEIAGMARAMTVFRANALKVREQEATIEAERMEAEQRRQIALDRMAANFESSVGGVVAALVRAAGDMARLSESMGEAADSTAGQADTVARSSAQASGNTHAVAAATEELSASIHAISDRLEHAIAVSGRADSEARTAADLVARLSECANRVGEVVRLINDVAGQTNLLALNATIEAARAGEAGRGFAVVAGEVKSLSTQTAKATDDIASEISAIQSVVVEVVRSIGQIGQTITDLTGVAGVIAKAVEEQNAATAAISRSIADAAAGVGGVTSTIGEVRLAALETGRCAGSVRSAADELSQQAAHLEAAVAMFLREVRAG